MGVFDKIGGAIKKEINKRKKQRKERGGGPFEKIPRNRINLAPQSPKLSRVEKIKREIRTTIEAVRPARESHTRTPVEQPIQLTTLPSILEQPLGFQRHRHGHATPKSRLNPLNWRGRTKAAVVAALLASGATAAYLTQRGDEHLVPEIPAAEEKLPTQTTGEKEKTEQPARAESKENFPIIRKIEAIVSVKNNSLHVELPANAAERPEIVVKNAMRVGMGRMSGRVIFVFTNTDGSKVSYVADIRSAGADPSTRTLTARRQ